MKNEMYPSYLSRYHGASRGPLGCTTFHLDPRHAKQTSDAVPHPRRRLLEPELPQDSHFRAHFLGCQCEPDCSPAATQLLFAERQQAVVNQLRSMITPCIEKKIGKAFNNVRHRQGGAPKVKIMDRIALLDVVDELKERQAIKDIKQRLRAERYKQEKVKQAQQQAAEEKQAMRSATVFAGRRAAFVTAVAVPFHLERDALGRAVIHRP